jgi:hypothetical protein
LSGLQSIAAPTLVELNAAQLTPFERFSGCSRD